MGEPTVKPIWNSLTFWMNLAGGMAVLLLPAVQVMVSGHPKAAAVAAAIGNIMLRFKTTQGVAIK